ncbi:MAG TPA: TetR/AcrR family transcriptional regulator [Acidimicrobiales bacterium]
MARPKEFDPELVLDRAMELFWEHGYEATSMADLTERLGIGRASLYATFGDKRTIYRRALQRYLESRDPSPIELLSQPGPVLPAVRTLVDLYVNEGLHDPLRRGCLVVNSAIELMPDDDAVCRIVEGSWNTLEITLTSALTRAQAQGEIAPDRDPRGLARFLLTLLQGLRVLGKGPADPGRLRDAADQALQAIEG